MHRYPQGTASSLVNRKKTFQALKKPHHFAAPGEWWLGVKTGAHNTMRIEMINATVVTTCAGPGVGHSDPRGSLSVQDLLGIHAFKTGSPEMGDQRGRRSAMLSSKNLINKRRSDEYYLWCVSPRDWIPWMGKCSF